MCKPNSKIKQYFNQHALQRTFHAHVYNIFFRRMRPDWRYTVAVQHGCHWQVTLLVTRDSSDKNKALKYKEARWESQKRE